LEDEQLLPPSSPPSGLGRHPTYPTASSIFRVRNSYSSRGAAGVARVAAAAAVHFVGVQGGAISSCAPHAERLSPRTAPPCVGRPRAFTIAAAQAGAKNDPADNEDTASSCHEPPIGRMHPSQP